MKRSWKKYWDEECEMCERPVMLHTGLCERKTEVGDDEYGEIWREWRWFKEKIDIISLKESIRKRQEDQEEKKETQSDIRLGLQNIEDNIESGSDDENREEDNNVANVSEEKLEKRWSELGNKNNWDEECEMCERLVILHDDECTRKTELGEDEYG